MPLQKEPASTDGSLQMLCDKFAQFMSHYTETIARSTVRANAWFEFIQAAMKQQLDTTNKLLVALAKDEEVSDYPILAKDGKLPFFSGSNPPPPLPLPPTHDLIEAFRKTVPKTPPPLPTTTLTTNNPKHSNEPPSLPLYTVANVFVPHYKSTISNLRGPSLLACTLVFNNNQQETCFLRSSGLQISSTFLVSKNLPCKRFEDEAGQRREWRPPWRPQEHYVATKQNATGRREWRLPWKACSILEDKHDLKGRGVDTDHREISLHSHVHHPSFNSFHLFCF
ncbi:hypothetical protein HanRHA438_Chr04g0155191 [Helianthus annuus]|nr:hypothetical protein HanRHA438_Chr04g0155191 [Helianthus annuus]